jgi:hypothetical protein
VLHAVGHTFQDGTTVNLAAWDSSHAKNLFAGHTVYSIVLEVPDKELLAGAPKTRRIGVWAVATLATDAGDWRSINRVGLPMIPCSSRNTTKTSVILSMPGGPRMTLESTGKPSSSRLPL